MTSANLSPEDVLLDLVARGRGALGSLPRRVGKRIDVYQQEPSPGSLAAFELATSPRPQSVASSHILAKLLLTSSADYMFGLQRTLKEPTMTEAPFALARGVLEAAARASWLLDPNIDVVTRVSRSMSLRLSGLESQATLTRSSEKSHRVAFAGVLQKSQGQIGSLKREAKTLGIRVRIKKGKLTVFGEGLPSNVNLAARFGEEPMYRLLSAVAHSEYWATFSVSYVKSDRKAGVVEQGLRPEAALFLTQACIKWFSRVAWDYFALNGWGLKRLSSILESEFDKISVAAPDRFWRKTNQPVNRS